MKYVVLSPGRINLIGEHTDYSGGYAMPMAINLYTRLEASKFEIVELFSEHFMEHMSFDPQKQLIKTGRWIDYVMGVYKVVHDEGMDAGGMKGTISGNLPVGSGLSSSASLELAILEFLDRAYSLGIPKLKKAVLAKKAENEFVGVPCGILDQFAIVFGKEDHAIFMDTETLEYEYVPIPEDIGIVVFHSGIRRSLSASEYSKRRKLVEESLAMLGKTSSKYINEGDIKKLPTEIHKKRMGYVIRENQRVLAARDALKEGDVELFGKILTEAHWDLAKEYEVSCGELDFLVRTAGELGAYGARLTGAGFGGAVIIIANKEKVGEISRELFMRYRKVFRWEAEYYFVKASDGVGLFGGAGHD